MPVTRFPVLSTIANLLRIAGWILVAVAALYGVLAGVLEPMQPGHRFDVSDVFDLAGGLAGAVVGLITVAFGEAIGVLFAIEENTRQR